MKVKLGIAPINWSNDDLPELGGETPVEQCLAEMREAGFAGTEIGNKFPKDGRAIRSLLGNYGLELASAWHSTFFLSASLGEELQSLERKLALLRDVGAKRINLCECTGTVHGDISKPLSARPRVSDWTRLCDGLNEAARVSEQFGITVAYHHHMGTVIQTEDEIDELLSRSDIGLCFDSGHLRFAGADPIKCWSKFESRVTHVHLKDIRPLKDVGPSLRAQAQRSEKQSMSSGFEENLDCFATLAMTNSSFLETVKAGVFTVPGDGSIDFVSLITKILASDYRGWMIVEAEQDPAKANPLQYALKAKSYINGILNANAREVNNAHA